MAVGDIIWFDRWYQDVGRGLHDMHNDEFRLGIITDALTPAADDPDPRWGDAGDTDLSAEEVTPGGEYSAGGPAISDTTYALDMDGEAVFEGDPVEVAQDAGNPEDGRWGVVYNNTDAGKRAVCAVDFGEVRDMTAAPLAVIWHEDGIMIMGAVADE